MYKYRFKCVFEKVFFLLKYVECINLEEFCEFNEDIFFKNK